MKFIIGSNQHNEIFSDKCGVLVSGKVSDEINYLHDKVKRLEAENAKLRECVEFYANQSSWMGYHRDVDIIASSDCEPSKALSDDFDISLGGKRARQVLKELEE